MDDHASFLEPLAFMFEQEPDFAVVAQAGPLTEARRALKKLSERSESVNVAVVDVNLPDGEGTELLGDLRALTPRCAVLILSGTTEREQLARAVEQGASGLLHKSARIRDVIAAARRLAAGELLLSPEEIREMMDLASRRREQNREARLLLGQLTQREREVLQAFAAGLSDSEIAARLYVRPATVRTHMVNVLTKLEVDSRLQALLLAARHGAVEIH